MAELMRVPEVAAGATDVVLAQWLVNEGTSLRAGDAVAVIETDKAQVEVEADRTAVLLHVLVPEGKEISVGAPMALLGQESDLGTGLEELLAQLGVQLEHVLQDPVRRELSDEPAVVVSRDAKYGVGTRASGEIARKDATERRFASPLARRMLRDAGVDLSEVSGTGPGGRIVRSDAEAAIERSRSAAECEVSDRDDTSARPIGLELPESDRLLLRTPHSRLRRAIASRLLASKRDVPHFYLRRTIEVDDLLALRRQINESAEPKVSVNDLLVKAVAAAYRSVPEANVVWTDDELIQFESVDVAVAVASERGLVTPVVRDVARRSISVVSSEIKRLVGDANAGNLQQHELEGGALTVTNLGMHNVDDFAAIINPPQSMILSIGAVRSTPVVHDGQIVVASTLGVVLSVDHRAIDGVLAARWLESYATALQCPLNLLL